MKQQKSSGLNLKWVLVIVAAILVCSTLSWLIVNNRAEAKSDITTSTTQINNEYNHLKDSITGLNNFASNQTKQLADFQDQTDSNFTQTNSAVDKVNANTVQLRNDLTDMKAQADGIASDLDEKTNDLSGQIVNANGKIDSATSTLNDTANSLASLAGTVNTMQTAVNNIQTAVSYMTISIPSGVINTSNSADRYIFTANANYMVVNIMFQQSAIENTGNSTTLTIRKVPNGTVISSGLDLLSSDVNIKTGVTANTVLSPALTSTTSSLQLTAGDSLALDVVNTVTEYYGCVTITVEKQ